jgi:FkbM family methyltransferase
MSYITQSLKSMIPPGLKARLLEVNRTMLMRYGMQSYSQEGEDMLLNKIFLGRKTGFYVDVGAHHPVAFSNTYLFYRRGWRGINIDPIPGTAALFQRRRPRDISLEMGVMSQAAELPYYTFKNAVLNTCSEEMRDRLERQGCPSLGTLRVPCDRLEAILDRHVPRGGRIDFMTIDVEGMEHVVLDSNNWDLYRPKIICMEVLDTNVVAATRAPTVQYLADRGYELFAKLDNTAFLKERSFRF